MSIILLLSSSPAFAKRTVRGTITDITGKPVKGVLVKAWDRDSGSKKDFMGKARTNSKGRYAISYKSGHWDKAPHNVTTWRPDIFIEVYATIKGKLVKVKQSKTYKNRKHKHDTTINLQLAGTIGSASPKVSVKGIPSKTSPLKSTSTTIRSKVAIDTVPLPERVKLTNRSFSADFVQLNANGSIKHKAKVYVTPQKMRMEMNSKRIKGKIITIIRRDLNLQWSINTTNKTYLQIPLQEEEINRRIKKYKGTRSTKSYRAKNISGYKITKPKVRNSVLTQNNKRKTFSKTVWFSSRLGVPVAEQDSSGARTELRNIREGSFPKRFFELPQGYRRK